MHLLLKCAQSQAWGQTLHTNIFKWQIKLHKHLERWWVQAFLLNGMLPFCIKICNRRLRRKYQSNYFKKQKEQRLVSKQTKKQRTPQTNHVKKINTTFINELTPPQTTSYSIVHSAEQWVEMSKSTIVEIDFGPMVIVRKWVAWQQFHSLIHITTHIMVFRWFFSLLSIFFLFISRGRLIHENVFSASFYSY
jgi:hypothetical protein